ncbi:PAS domain S-box-containing protein [Stella humosa]|uniref:histidine kinase n=2 Tax=Stella humosa TaxID=94 RepID=A0A3N1MEK5_9PROT|nr:PAS domain S-box-containing protein [Stella humosa]
MKYAPDIFFDQHPDPMWIYSIDTLRFLDVNAAATARYGYSRDEFLAMTIADIRPEEDAPALRLWIDAGLTGLRESGIWRHRLKSGKVIQAAIRSQPVTYQGQPSRLVSTMDVTRLLELEKDRATLLEQQATMRTAQRLLGIGIWKMNLESGALSWSENLYEMYGIAADHFGHRFDSYIGVVHPDDRAMVLAQFEAFAQSTERYFDFRHRISRRDGKVITVKGLGERTQSSVGPILTGVVQDISDQVAAAERLSEATNLVKIAGRTGKLGGWRLDLARWQVEWSEETAAIHDAADIRTLSVDEAVAFYRPEYRDRVRATVGECIDHRKPFDEVWQIVTAVGTVKWVRAIGEPEYLPDGSLKAIHGAFQDMTELEATRERSADLSRRLQETLENISDAFITLDAEWHFTFVNSQAESLLGSERLRLLGRPAWEALGEAARSSFEAECRKVVDSRTATRFVTFYAPTAKWLDVNAYPSTNGIAVYFRDITRSRAQQEQLRLLEAAVSRQNDILLITAADAIDEPAGPKIVYVNDAFVRRTGYTREEAIGRTPRFLQGARTDRHELGRIRAALAQGQPYRGQLVNYAKNGEEFWLELDIVPLADPSGSWTHWVSVERDITDRKRSEESIRISDERFRLLSKVTNDVVWDWNLETGSNWWNDNVKVLFGYEPDDIEPGLESWTGRIHPEDRGRVIDRLNATLQETGESWTDEYRFRHADGHYATVIDRGFIIRGAAGQAVRMVGSMIDVTERRRLDDQLRQAQKLEAVGQLTGGIAHDFNNLLTVILGNTELLSEQLAGQQSLRALADTAVKATERGAELTSRLLSFARRQSLDPKLVDLNALVAGMDDLLGRTLTENIDIQIACGKQLWPTEIDPGQFEVALLNLAINARDAMPAGGRLTIETCNLVLDAAYVHMHGDIVGGDYVMVSVSDTGTGMPPDIALRAFEPFFTTKEVGKGSGLGLSMVYGFLKQSGGHAVLYSEPGQGTSVKLYFQRALSVDPPVLVLPTQKVIVGGHEHILLAEDDPMVRRHLADQLTALGYDVIAAENGPQAVAILETVTDIDLLLTDVIMPGGMDGRELADAARILRPDIRILFSSGYSEAAIVHHGRLNPGTLLLLKPYRRQELAAKVREALDRRPG